MSLWCVILAGGIGSRFWPVSTPRRPKQLLPLVSDAPLLSDALERLAPLADAAHTLVLTNAELTREVQALAPALPNDQIIAEPRPAGTAAALAWAAHTISERAGRDAVMLSVHADWAIGDPDGFRATLQRAAAAALKYHALVTVGIVPDRPDPGFGYIHPGEAVEGELHRVAEFVEKPGYERAAEMVRQGYLWNSGIFAWRVGDFLDEVRAHTPEVAPALDNAGGNAERFFGAVRPIAVDVGVLERSNRVMVLPGQFGWDDVGTWAALRRVRQRDSQGNAVFGPVHAVDARDNIVHAEAGDVVLFGVEGLVVVQRPGLTLVTTAERAADLKKLVESLPTEVRERP